MRSKEITFTAFGSKHTATAEMFRYPNGNLGIRLMEKAPEGYEECWGVLTKNIEGPELIRPRENQAYIKTYSENEQWAAQVLKALGAKDTGISADSGYVTLPLYEFDIDKIFS